MADLILHHYEGSPFAHKIRRDLRLQGPGLAVRRDSDDHAEAGPDAAQWRLPADAGHAGRRRHLSRHPADRRRAGKTASGADPVPGGRRRPGPCAHLLGRRRPVRRHHRRRLRSYRRQDAAGLFRRPGRHARAGAGYAGEDHGRRAPAGRGVEPARSIWSRAGWPTAGPSCSATPPGSPTSRSSIPSGW